jgi:hypothetical protein
MANDSAGDGLIGLIESWRPNTKTLGGTAAACAVLSRTLKDADGFARVMKPHLDETKALSRELQRSLRRAPPPWSDNEAVEATLGAALGQSEWGVWRGDLLDVPGAGDALRAWCIDNDAAFKRQAAKAGSLYDLAGSAWWLGLVALLPVPLLTVRNLKTWRRYIATADANTSEEREFWDDYLANLNAVLALLDTRVRPTGAAPAVASE